MISRYAFLEYMDKLEQKYAIRFHKGSSDLEGIKADTELFISRFGKNRLNEVAKLHFKNFDPYR